MHTATADSNPCDLSVTTVALNCTNTHLIGFSIRRSNHSENA